VRYRVKGHIIRSENAAKPPTQPLRPVVEWLKAIPRVERALDYGCGKLRYAPYLAARARQLVLVDSSQQLDRMQQVRPPRSVRQEAVRRWRHAIVLTVEDFRTKHWRYDLALCANVLSAIPSARVRADVIRVLASRLAPAGRCLFVTQFRNTYYRDISKSRRAVPHLDGWLHHGRNGPTYYGLIPKDRLCRLVTRYGHRVERAWVENEAALVLTTRR
jgi:SAM-dependent methyltransferase